MGSVMLFLLQKFLGYAFKLPVWLKQKEIFTAASDIAAGYVINTESKVRFPPN